MPRLLSISPNIVQCQYCSVSLLPVCNRHLYVEDRLSISDTLREYNFTQPVFHPNNLAPNFKDSLLLVIPVQPLPGVSGYDVLLFGVAGVDLKSTPLSCVSVIRILTTRTKPQPALFTCAIANTRSCCKIARV
jgi:hypothetical protein